MQFTTEVRIDPSEQKISHNGGNILTLGSCFADEIGRRLEQAMFPVSVNPFGALYNPASIANALDAVENCRHTLADITASGDRYVCLDFHSHISGHTPQEALTNIHTASSEVRETLAEASWLILTLGSARVFTDNDTGRIVGNCHKLPAQRFTVGDLTVEQCIAHISRAVDTARRLSPGINILLTVSPIRHKAYGLHADKLSKATLLLAVDAVCRSKNCLYFPSYEIMLDELRDYRFYADDMVHPSSLAADYIFSRFSDTYFTPETAALATRCSKIARRFRHLLPETLSAEQEAFRNDTIDVVRTLTAGHPYLSTTANRLLNNWLQTINRPK